MWSRRSRGESFFFLVGTTVLVALGWVACGGDVRQTDDDGENAGGMGGSSSAGGSGGEAGSDSGGGGSGSGGAPDGCESVPDYLDNLYQAAAACAPADPVPHCQGIVDGYCCPVVVESASSPATLAYLDFLELTKTQCPEMWDACAAVDCALPIGGTCVPDAVGSGVCEPDF